ncbi:arylsulfatase [Seonamhaeicola sp. MEBiC1930]|uniref:arylsulfatase n=1 Tax=Seonamhaeicola sp. MEBiC01930 TaxID=2976768 RepID=UPI0032496AFF
MKNTLISNILFKNCFALFSVVIALCMLSCNEKVKEVEKPNVILILIDDQGYGDISALGNPFIKTTNIDNLYNSSARFTDYHVSPTCSPTRAALLTGHHNNRTGVWHTVNGRSMILERENTAAQIFKDNGYNTAIFGKWHLGDNYPFRPQDKGFDEVLTHGGGGMEQTMDYWDNDYFNDMYIHNGKLKRYKGYSADIWFDEAIKWIDSKEENEPFFCYLPSNTAHSPYFVEDKYYDDLKDNKDIPHAPFLGMINNIDENLGKLMSYLKESGKLENTIIVYTTDNGTAQGAKTEGHRLDGFIRKGFNAGMRGVKASKYEGGHRVPLFIHWEGGDINKGKDIHELTAHYDVLPTLADLCNLNVNDNKFDGQSLIPLINGDNSNFKDRIVITNSQRVEVPEPWRRTSLMQGKWRLVDGEELYNLEADPEQRNNIIEQHPEKVKEFKKAYDEWWNEISPTYKDQPYIYLGHEAENPVKLFAHDWHTTAQASPWHQRHIRTAYVDNGYWLLKVANSGKYKLQLRRWPEEIKLPLNGVAPVRPAIPGTSVSESKASKALNIEMAKISIQGNELTKAVDSNQEFVEFEVELEKGNTTLQTWFTLDNGTELGAYYVNVLKI